MRRWYVWLPISALLLGFVIWRTRPWEIGGLWNELDRGSLLAALALNVPVVLLWAIRSRFLMEGVGHPLSVAQLVPVVSFANTVNNLTPASTGEVLRALVLKERYGVPYGRSAAVIVAERLWPLGIMVLTAFAAASGELLRLPGPIVALAWAGAAFLSFLPALAYRAGLRPGRLVRRLAGPDSARSELPSPSAAAKAVLPVDPIPKTGRLARFATALGEVDDQLAALITPAGRALGFVLSTAAIFACFGLQLWFVLLALGVSISPLAAWAVLGLALLAGIVSALPFGLGATDAVLTLLLATIGVEAAAAGAAALLLRATATLPLGIAGTVSWVLLTGGARPSKTVQTGTSGPP
ncbi:MAG: flippase-like domain-containing protein [Chloroflexi bacterium]|nr:flippase-like domain-containing protein [Chloroflexota bacterium]